MVTLHILASDCPEFSIFLEKGRLSHVSCFTSRTMTPMTNCPGSPRISQVSALKVPHPRKHLSVGQRARQGQVGFCINCST